MSEENERLEIYTENIRILLETRGYTVPKSFKGLERSELFTFTRPRPQISVSEGDENPELVAKAKALLAKGVKKFDVLKVYLRDPGDNLSVPEIRGIYETAAAEDPLGRGYVLMLWQSDEARRKLKGFKNGISPRVVVENPDILLTGLVQNMYWTDIRVVSALTVSRETRALIRNEYDNLPIRKSDDTQVIYYGLVPGDVFYCPDIGYGGSGEIPEYFRVAQNIL